MPLFVNEGDGWKPYGCGHKTCIEAAMGATERAEAEERQRQRQMEAVERAEAERRQRQRQSGYRLPET